MKIKALCFFPKSIKENITMSRGTDIYSDKGIFLYSLWLCQLCPPLHGERSLSQAESPLFTRVEDKKRPCMSFAKSFNARSFCLCRRVSHFCPFQNKWQCPVTLFLFKFNGCRRFSGAVIEHTVDAFYFVYNTAGYNIEDFPWKLCAFSCHEV